MQVEKKEERDGAGREEMKRKVELILIHSKIHKLLRKIYKVEKKEEEKRILLGKGSNEEDLIKIEEPEVVKEEEEMVHFDEKEEIVPESVTSIRSNEQEGIDGAAIESEGKMSEPQELSAD